MRIFVIVILVGLIPIMVMKSVILKNYVTQSVNQKSTLIQNQCQQLVSQMGSSGYIADVSKEKQVDKQVRQLANIYNGRVIIVDGNFWIVRDTFGIDEGKAIISEEVLKCFLDAESVTNYNAESRFLELTMPVKNSETKATEGIMIVSVSTEDINAGREALDNTVLILQVIVTLFVLSAAYYVARVLTKPFDRITQSLEEVNAGREALDNTVLILQVIVTLFVLSAAYYVARVLTKPFDRITQSLEEVRGGVLEQEISIPDYTETQLLAEAYNRMLKRMKLQEDSRQEFVSNVSHELKTPITSMKVLADSLLAQEDVPVELYKEFMSDIAEEIDRENKIISDLLSLVKMDKKSADIHIEETNINQLIELILKRLRPIAAKQGIDLVLESFKPILAEVDETKLTLALSNLVENGIKYNHEDGWVHVSLNVDSKYFYVKVEDSGMGIPEEDQEHIFERFYRVDKSHSREIGGTGLGLAITRSAVLMHHGAIKVYSKEDEGTTFTVRIPLKYVP